MTTFEIVELSIVVGSVIAILYLIGKIITCNSDMQK